MPFNQQMTFPCDLTLHAGRGGTWRLFRNPVREIELLHGESHTWKDLTLTPGHPQKLENVGSLLHILAQVEIPAGSTLKFNIRGTPVTVTDHSVACNSQPASIPSVIKSLEILVDCASIETFVNEGELSHSACFLPTTDDINLECSQGSAIVRSLQVIQMKSAWKKPSR